MLKAEKNINKSSLSLPRALQEQGFSLIEMLVVIFIMSILTTSVLVNYSNLNRSHNLALARNNLVSDLHRIQSFSLSSRDVSPGTPSSAYTLEMNTATPNLYALSGYDGANPPNRTLLYLINLPANIRIASINVRNSAGVNSNVNQLTSSFTNPYARVVQNYVGTSTAINEKDDTDTIVLSTADNSATISVVIDGITGNIITP